MSLYGALFSGISGMAAESSAMGAISDNITNVNTIGYKQTDVNFQTLVTKQVSVSAYSPGGVQSKPRAGINVQGLLQSTSSSTDVAISGQGFFVVNSVANPATTNTGQFGYSRAGSFSVDKNGYLCNTAGYYLQGWPLANWDGTATAAHQVINGETMMSAYKNSSGQYVYINQGVVNPTNLQSFNLNDIAGTASATSSVRMGANLPSADEVGQDEQTNIQIYDTLGNSHNVLATWQKTGQNQWDIESQPPEGAKNLTLYDSSGNVYSTMGRLDFSSVPSAGAMTMTIGGTTYTFDASAGTSGSTGNTLNIDPSAANGSSGTYAANMAAAMQQAYEMQYCSVSKVADASSGTATTALAAASNLSITVAGTTYKVSLAGIDPTTGGGAGGGLATAINTALVAAGVPGTVTASFNTSTNLLSLNNGTGAAITVSGSGDLVDIQGSIANGAAASTSAGDLDVYAASTLTLGAKVLTMTGLTRAAALNLINNNASTTKVSAMLNGGNFVLYTGTAGSTSISATGDFAGAVGGTAAAANTTFNGTTLTGTGTTYADQISGTSSIEFRNFDTSTTTGTLTVGGLTSLTNSSGAFSLEQALAPTSPSGFTLPYVGLNPSTTNAITFNGDGTPSAINVASMSIEWANGSEDMTTSNAVGVSPQISLFMGDLNVSDGMTQLSGNYQLSYMTQNGAKFGNFSGVSVGSDGIVTALFDNGVTRPVFQVPIATFVNPDGMESLTGNVYESTDVSGDPTLRVAGTAGAGTTTASSLEASTVDIGAQFTTMIVTQRAYTAASKIITTANQMLDDLVQIIR